MSRALLVSVVAFLAWTGSAAGATGILAVGDFGVGGTTERAMGTAMRTFESTHPADLLVTLGDNDYTESPDAFHSNWVASFGWRTAAGVAVAGTLGNHDIRVNGGRYEFDELNMPRAYYTRTVGNVQFFILNSNSVKTTQTTWLKNALAGSTAIWKIVVYHHPAWTCGGYRSNAAVVRYWVPLFERYHVDLSLSGHDHNYQRFAVRRGVRYLVHGGGGQHLYPIEPCPSSYPRRIFARAVHGFLYLRASDTVLRGASVTRAGNVIDRFSIYP
ncbi:MAG TPA: metallophosphoesterase [Gaiellaceae bacterium]